MYLPYIYLNLQLFDLRKNCHLTFSARILKFFILDNPLMTYDKSYYSFLSGHNLINRNLLIITG